MKIMNAEEILCHKRRKIDCIDAHMVRLLEKRFKLATDLKILKGKITDTKRESEVLVSVQKNVKETKFAKAIVVIFADIIRQSKKIQRSNANLPK